MPEDEAPHAGSLWRNRAFLLLWGGQAISTLGSASSGIAVTLLILDLTRSPAQAGFVGTLGAVPYLILSLPAGVLADRWDRKRMMILCDTGRAIALGSVPAALWIGHLTPLQLYLVVLIERTLFVFYNVAQAACLPRVVAPEQLPAARAWNEVAFYGVGTLFGPTLGGVLYQTIGRAIPFLADAISYALSVLSLFAIKLPFQTARDAPPRALHGEIIEGLAWVWRQPLIRAMAALSGGFVFVNAGAGLILIVLARSLRAPPAAIGAVFSIGAVGGIIGALVGSQIQRRVGFGPVIIGVLWIAALLWPLYAVAPTPVILGIIAAGLYAVEPVYNVVQFSHILPLIPDALQGRVNSIFYLIAVSGAPIGLALTGVLLQSVGVTVTVFIFFGCRLCLALVATFNPQVRHARPLVPARPAP